MLACGCDVVFRVDHVEGNGPGSDASTSGIAYVQSAGQALGGVTTHNLPFNSPVQTGSLVVVALTTYKGTLTNVSDSAIVGIRRAHGIHSFSDSNDSRIAE